MYNKSNVQTYSYINYSCDDDVGGFYQVQCKNQITHIHTRKKNISQDIHVLPECNA